MCCTSFGIIPRRLQNFWIPDPVREWFGQLPGVRDVDHCVPQESLGPLVIQNFVYFACAIAKVIVPRTHEKIDDMGTVHHRCSPSWRDLIASLPRVRMTDGYKSLLCQTVQESVLITSDGKAMYPIS